MTDNLIELTLEEIYELLPDIKQATIRSLLSRMVKSIRQKNIAGVYGRQLPLHSTSSDDARDLLVTFGNEDKIQKKDPFFHNANSIIKKDIWNKINFDEIEMNSNYKATPEDLEYFKKTFEEILFDQNFIKIFNLEKIKKFILEIS